MKVIGITGGVGSGKTSLLAYIREHYKCRMILADDVANRLKEPGQRCYQGIVSILGKEILDEDGTINKGKMAAAIFQSSEKLQQVNELIHPAVKNYIKEEIASERQSGKRDFLFLEAALLIECGYMKMVDEMWYIYADCDVRKRRLRENRNYSDEKSESIISAQLADEEYRRNCSVVIDNSGELEEAYRQIDKKLEEYLWER